LPSQALPVFRSSFGGPRDDPRQGKRPVIFDILGPDHETSILPGDTKFVLHVNPRSMSMNYAKIITRTQTKGGYVEQHWGDGLQGLGFEMATGGFMRLYSGLSNITAGYGANNLGGSRRQTIAYDKYLDMLALFHCNGAIYDGTGQIVFEGIIRVTFDEGIYEGWFKTFSVAESTDQPYQFTLNADFEVHEEILTLRTTTFSDDNFLGTGFTGTSPETIPTANATTKKGSPVVRNIPPTKGQGTPTRSLRNLQGYEVDDEGNTLW
jgi:hypothetical protein